MSKITATSAIVLCLVAPKAWSEITINGFASIYAGKATSNDTVYGYDDEISLENESKFALQVIADLGDDLSATAQIISRGSDDFDASFEWAYVTYTIDDASQLSVGKMRIPFYKYSDYLDVGYAYRWVRPPQSVYGLSFSTYEGASYLYTGTIGNWDSSIQLLYGNLSQDIVAFTDADTAEMNTILGVNWTLEYDWFSYRIAYLIADVSVDSSNSPELSGLVAALQQYNLQSDADMLITNDDSGYFLGTGFAIDYNDFLIDAEYTELEVDNSALAPQSQYFISLGYRFDEIVIHTTYESNKDEHNSNRFNTVPTTVPHPQFGQIPVSTDPTNPSAPLLRDLNNAVLNAALVDTTAWSIGLRYNFHPVAALKLDYTRLKDKVSNNSSGLVSMGVDLVF